MAERVRLIDVAREAGTSVSTVSRALNGSDLISPEVVAHVRAVAGQLGYRADKRAQEFKLGRPLTVGVTVPDLTNPFFSEVLKGLNAAARAGGYRLLIGESSEDPAEELRLVDELVDYSGALVLCSSRLTRAGLEKALAQPVPVVCINRTVKNAGVVAIDYRAASRLLLEHLTGLGHRRVLYVGGPATSWSDGERRRTLRRTARALDVTLDEIDGGWSGNHGYDAGPTVLHSRATAVITFNDLVGIGLLSWMYDNGVEVPSELSVASYDDIPIAAYSRPPLTSLRNERAKLGELAWEQLTKRLAGADWPAPDLLTPELVVRASTGPARRRARIRAS
ncbi:MULTISPECIES: LacI family DNA-binding transcriptional regulator [Kribbella]|uniref:LacI family transcriptional regulator n=1 Tax=Kribbella pratensis TaxID=2512112 RepID=A0ABY2F5L8_9ACTN|nr:MULTISPECIES: LacI family DNA-binding transcriptional regulator [Kribbella]TDW81847.1 LacI family transcriptional regulator [Kribbella pratensis]TDW83333.1 LacI family transcriptional regulator [Kribbella sp. VKM Ac-2566]